MLTGALMAGCAGEEAQPPATDTAPAAGETAVADPTEALREKCLSAMPEDADLEAMELHGATDGTISAARIGPETSEAVAVLLPQTSGMCGWGRWATLAAREGVTSLLVDPCGYGASECGDAGDADPLNEVGPAIALARGELGARRVVLVGTSMGGSLTVQAAAAGADVEGWVDVSGPSGWDGVDQADLAADLPPGGIVVYARSDGAMEFRRARALAREAGARFVDGDNGHGWELLVDPIEERLLRPGTVVLDHVRG